LAKRVFIDERIADADADSLQFDERSVVEVVWRLIRDYVLVHWPLMSLAIVAMVFVAATTGALPFLMQNAADEIFIAKNPTMLYVVPALVVAVMALRGVAEYGSKVTEAFIGNRLIADIRGELFARLMQQDLGWLQSTHTGRFVSVFMYDTNVVNAAAAKTLTAIFKNLLQVLFLIGAMFYMDWLLSLLLLAALPFGVVLMRLQRRRMRRSVRQTLQETGDLGSLATQALQGVRVVKSYGQEERETARARRTIDRTLEYTMQTARTRSATGPVMEALSGLGLAAAIFYGGWQGIAGSLTLGQFMGFMTAAMLVYQPLKALVNLNNMLLEGVSAASRVFGILDRANAVAEAEDAAPLKPSEGAIRFDDVSFAYEDGKPVVENLTLDVPPGSRVALVGPSGAGKSTLLNLVPRFFDPSGGRILIDGQDIREATIASVRGASALLTQEPVLFDDTVYNNIAYGSAAATSEAVVEAARGAAADEFIEALGKGYQTPVGEAGNLLSGGQKQRIALARAMLRDCPIILLDEPTSALDAKSEAQVQRALETLLKGRTVLMIAHRLSTIRHADLICVMDKGRIVERGTHEELIAGGGLYADLNEVQMLSDDEGTAPAPEGVRDAALDGAG